jgi:sugar phosphate isomerase/epimerase
MTSFRTDSQPEYRIPNEDFIFYKKVFLENLDFLLDMNKKQFPICVENYNLEQSTLDMIIPYLERGDIFLCWDIAKSFKKPELEDFFFGHLSWVKQVHLHDQRRNPDGQVRTHCVIGTGEIDFKTYLSVLSKADVQDFCIEVRPREKARESLEILKQIIKKLN